jgi:hypothetical protein
MRMGTIVESTETGDDATDQMERARTLLTQAAQRWRDIVAFLTPSCPPTDVT